MGAQLNDLLLRTLLASKRAWLPNKGSYYLSVLALIVVTGWDFLHVSSPFG